MEHDKESLLSAIVEGSPYAKILVNERGLITLMNAQAENLFGWSREELVGQSIETIVPDRFRRGHPSLRAVFSATPIARPMGAGRDLYGRRKDGTEVPIEIGLNPIDAGSGKLTLAAITDITERKRAEELRLNHTVVQQHAAEVEELNRELAGASAFKSQFVATMSHELRTPLTAIISAAELLVEEGAAGRSRAYVQTIVESAEGLLALINNIMDFSKIEAGGLNLQTSAFSVESVLESAADVVAHLAREKRLTLHTYVDPSIPAVQGDADCLRQVLLNLLGNAVKFTQRGRIVARVQPVELSEHGVRLRFEVQDSGSGISPEDRARLFEPFVQVQPDASRKAGGSGLGLSISKRLVELMGGEIGVVSEPGEGSLFWFVAPFGRALESVSVQERSLVGLGGFVITSDEMFAQILERYLLSWGMKCRRAASSLDVLDALQENDTRGWVALIDLDDVGSVEMSQAVAAVRAILPSRLITIGGGGPIRKPLRQSYLFDAIVNAYGLETLSQRDATYGSDATLEPAPLDATILVAEDNERLQPLLKLQFERLGIPVKIVGDGRAAVDALRRTNFAMVFMDCQMPVLDGLAATREIRDGERFSGAHVPIVAMTANAFAEDREACLAAGMDDYLAKPVRLADLYAAVQSWAGFAPKRPV